MILKNRLYLCLFFFLPFFAFAQETLDSITTTNRQSLSKVLEGDFNKFFNLEEKGRTVLSANEISIHYKTGGFQEYIDVFIVKNNKELIVQTKLIISREWMKGANLRFAIDIIKSFVIEFAMDKEHIQPLVEKLWQFGTDKEPELTDENLIGCFDVFQGKIMNYNFRHNKQVFIFSNQKVESAEYIFVLEVH